MDSLVHFAKGCWDLSFLPANGLSIKPLKVKLLAEEQKATEDWWVGGWAGGWWVGW